MRNKVLGIFGLGCLLIGQAGSVRAGAEPPVIPDIGPGMVSNLRSIMNSTAGRTRYRDVFMKVGDSITATGSYLEDLGCQNMNTPPLASYDGATWGFLIPTTQYFARRSFPLNYSASWCSGPDSGAQSNAFNRSSRAAESGVTSAFPLSVIGDNNTPGCPSGTVVLTCEIQKMNPAFALIMLGTNDVMQSSELPAQTALTQYTNRMTALVDACISQGIVPVVSTIPPLLDTTYTPETRARVNSYNQALIDLATLRNIPLWNYHRALIELGSTLNYGMDPDGIHPNIYVSGGNAQGDVFTTAGLRYGYNVRNKTTLEVLRKLQTQVLEEIFANGFE